MNDNDWDAQSSEHSSVDEDDIFQESEGSGSGDNYTEDATDGPNTEASESEAEDYDASEGGEHRNDGPEGIVENQIEGDFDRLVGKIRSSDDVANEVAHSLMLRKIWDTPFQDESEDANFHDDLRAASGIGRVGKGKGKGNRQRRQGPVLSYQVRALIGEGNQAYVDGDLAGAIRLTQEVVRIEPRAASAWSVLTTCYRDMGEPLKALQLAVMGAHLRHDADEWHQLALQSRDLGYHQQALYCFRKVVSLDPKNVNALWDRATLAKETGELKVARHAYLAILKHHPHDLGVLDALRHVLVDIGDLEPCATLFQNAFEHYSAVYPFGAAPTADGVVAGEGGTGGGFALLEILVLADLHNALGAHERAVTAIRRGVRWLQGRGAQRFWDVCPDDREFDREGHTRENSTVRMQPGFYPLDINARHRLAVARLKLGEIDEGKMHAEVILAQNVLDYAPLFAEIADAYFERGMFAEARPIYELLGADAGTSSMEILVQAAACRRNLGDLRDAAEVYEHVIATDPNNNDAKMKLAEIYEITNEPRKALELVYEVIDARKKRIANTQDGGTASRPDAAPATTSLFEERPRGRGKAAKAQSRLSKAELQELERQREQDTQRAYERVKHLWPAMLRGAQVELEAEAAGENEGVNEWLLEAEKLVESFREARQLFFAHARHPYRYRLRGPNRSSKTTEQEEDIMASRLHLDLAQDSRKVKLDDTSGKKSTFRGITFDDWLTLFIQYTFLLTQRDQLSLAEEVLRHVLISSVYQSRITQDTLRLTIITCALRQKNFSLAIEQSRKIISAHQFNNEPLRIMLGILASGLPATDHFIASNLQKHLLREMKLSDAAVKGKGLQWNPASRRYAPAASNKNTDDVDDDAEAEDDVVFEDAVEKFIIPGKPTKDNPVLPTVYGQICSAVKSYQSALFYLLHSYDYQPNDPMICLSLAVASIGRAMQRQADNRNYLITQALGFLSQYRSHRGATDDAPEADEVEFNFGRAFHQLGLLSHAVHHYERTLQIVEKRLESDPNNDGLSKEAAYNLSLIYMTTGATGLAQALYRRWLSI